MVIKEAQLGKITQKRYGEYPWSSGLELEFVYQKNEMGTSFQHRNKPAWQVDCGHLCRYVQSIA